MNRNLKKFIILISIVLLSLFMYLYGITYAKYAADSVWNYYLKSKGFYFSSDYLDMQEVKNVDNLWDGGSVIFNIRNNLNQTTVTNYDISYTASCEVIGEAESYAECKINGTNSDSETGVLSGYQRCVNKLEDQIDVSEFEKTECEIGGYDWISDIAIKDMHFDVSLTDEEESLDDVVVRVKVVSDSPYKKTIQGLFTLHKGTIDEGKISSSLKNYSSYDKLIVTNTYLTNKCVKISWDSSKALIDLGEITNYSTNSNDYIEEININIPSMKSESYTFYAKNLASTNELSEFLVEESNDCN